MLGSGWAHSCKGERKNWNNVTSLSWKLITERTHLQTMEFVTWQKRYKSSYMENKPILPSRHFHFCKRKFTAPAYTLINFQRLIMAFHSSCKSKENIPSLPIGILTFASKSGRPLPWTLTVLKIQIQIEENMKQSNLKKAPPYGRGLIRFEQ